jgi:hypothetical protein
LQEVPVLADLSAAIFQQPPVLVEMVVWSEKIPTDHGMEVMEV